MNYIFMRFPDGKARAFTLSYDDACRFDPKFSDIITSYGLKCTFNVNSNGEGNYGCTVDKIREYALNRGHEIAIHGYAHKALGLTRPFEGIVDVLDSRRKLESDFDMIVRGMAYADSGINRFTNTSSYEKVRSYLESLGVKYARVTKCDETDLFMLPEDFYYWMPTCHHSDEKLFEKFEKFMAFDLENSYCAGLYPRVFYVWGHSYEFEGNNNWELLTKICEKVSGHDNIWYATNGEIYDYVKAYESLEFSLDMKTVYNPTLFEIFFVVDKTPYSIKPGETLKL